MVTIALSSSAETTCQAYWTKRRGWVFGVRDLLSSSCRDSLLWLQYFLFSFQVTNSVTQIHYFIRQLPFVISRRYYAVFVGSRLSGPR
jgi:hypothetical protein